MTIFEILDGALSELDVPFYDHMPEFAEGEEDGLFITYSLYNVPYLFGDGVEKVTRYFITVSFFGQDYAQTDALFDSAENVLSAAEFRRAGTRYSKGSSFPGYYRIDEKYTFDL